MTLSAEGGSSEPPIRTRRSFFAWLFVSPAEPRLRAGWRLVLQTILQWILLLVVSLGLIALVPRVFTRPPASFSSGELLITQIGQLIAFTLSIFMARRILDRRSFVSLGLSVGRRAMVDFAVGIGITFLMMGLIFAEEWFIGWLRVTGAAWEHQASSAVTLSVLTFFVLCVLIGWNEELMSRGYHLQTISSGTTPVWGWILSSTVFGILHLANPHASAMAVGGIVLAGLFLGFAYLQTRQLWLSIGLHTGWNFFEGVVFGFPVSGLPFFHLPEISVSGPDLWTGGAFGPEAGLVLIPSLALGFLLVYLYSRGARAS